MAQENLDEPVAEREQALIQIKKRRDLQVHALSFVLFNAAVWVIWATTGAGYPWPAWITGLWAIGLLTNIWDVYVRRPITEADVRSEVDRLHPQH
jgi:hypothetical protein